MIVLFLVPPPQFIYLVFQSRQRLWVHVPVMPVMQVHRLLLPYLLRVMASAPAAAQLVRQSACDPPTSLRLPSPLPMMKLSWHADQTGNGGRKRSSHTWAMGVKGVFPFSESIFITPPLQTSYYCPPRGVSKACFYLATTVS